MVIELNSKPYRITFSFVRFAVLIIVVVALYLKNPTFALLALTFSMIDFKVFHLVDCSDRVNVFTKVSLFIWISKDDLRKVTINPVQSIFFMIIVALLFRADTMYGIIGLLTGLFPNRPWLIDRLEPPSSEKPDEI